MNRTIIVLILAISLLVGCTSNIAESETPASNEQPILDEDVEEMVVVEETLVKEFTVHSFNFGFEPSLIKVKKGETVRINFFNDEGTPHDFVIDKFNVRTNRISSGSSESVIFVADQEGTFAFYCSVSGHRALGMEGQLIVEP